MSMVAAQAGLKRLKEKNEQTKFFGFQKIIS